MVVAVDLFSMRYSKPEGVMSKEMEEEMERKQDQRLFRAVEVRRRQERALAYQQEIGRRQAEIEARRQRGEQVPARRLFNDQ